MIFNDYDQLNDFNENAPHYHSNHHSHNHIHNQQHPLSLNYDHHQQQQYHSHLHATNSTTEMERRLLTLSYTKLQATRVNKSSKRAIETPLSHSVIVWNFLKKLEARVNAPVSPVSKPKPESLCSLSADLFSDTTLTPLTDANSNIIQVATAPHKSLYGLNSCASDVLDKENASVCMEVDAAAAPVKTPVSSKTTAIGSERRSKMLSGKQAAVSSVEVSRKRYKSLLGSYSKRSDLSSLFGGEEESGGGKKAASGSLFSLWSAKESSPSSSSSSFLLCSSFSNFNSSQKSCSYEEYMLYGDGGVTAAAGFGGLGLPDSAQSSPLFSSSSSSSSGASCSSNIEQVINILIECE